MLLAQQIIVTATFPLHNPHQRLILHKIYGKIEAFKKIFMGSPFCLNAKNLANFLGLGKGRLCCVRSIVSGAKPLPIKCLIKTFIPSTFQ